jgi:fatty-acid peroxygenase
MLHDQDLWSEPQRFDPDRFRDVKPDEYTYVPQGGGDPMGHRCPGERIAIELIKVAARFLREQAAPTGQLRIPMNRMPTRPFAD